MSENPIRSIGFNAPRFPGREGHVESWFLRLNAPTEPKAIWLRATVLNRTDGTHQAEAWCALFDGDQTAAARHEVPFEDAQFSPEQGPLDVQVANLSLHLDENNGHTSGSLESGGEKISWDLSFDRFPGELGKPLSLLPTDRLIDAPLPKNKLLTPFPVAIFNGTVRWGSKTWQIENWAGMQGHNWGAAHSPEYAWGHCIFLDEQGEPFAFAEGASGRIELGPVNSPLLSMLTVRRHNREYRFDRLVDLWRQSPDISFPKWDLRMSGPAGKTSLSMAADPARMVCFGYDNPDRVRRFCLNSKTAQATVRVDPRNEDGFELSSPTGAALEFLQPTEHPQVQPVV